MAQDRMLLDPQLRDWVLFPIFVVMLLVGILRHYITLLLQSPPKKQPLKAIREQRALLRGQTLRANASYLPPSTYNSIKSYLQTSYTSGIFLKDGPPKLDADGKEIVSENQAGPANPFDPMAMDGLIGPMKNQMVMMVPQQILMSWINMFFSGFVLIKLPFPLTGRFKSMLQRGIDTQDMDVTWVSSLSWYFLNLFGLNNIYRLILGDDNAADASKEMQAMGGLGLGGAGGSAPGQPPPDYKKLYATERDNIELIDYKWVCDGVEDRILEKFGSKLGTVEARRNSAEVTPVRRKNE